MGLRLGPDGLAGEGDTEPALWEKALSEAYDRMVGAFAFGGVRAVDTADLAQDFFVWLAAHPGRASLVSGPCIGGVVTNYIRRYQRRAQLRRRREGLSLDQAPEARAGVRPATDETTVSVHRLERLLPALEVRLLHELQRGASWAEAAAAVGVPPGSRHWLRVRMAEHVRVAFSPRRPRKTAVDAATMN